jgi:ribosomal protein S18 acetylase RimI-like enzyme
LRKASYKDKDLVAEILTSAFESSNEASSINLTVKQDERRVDRMKILMEYLFERAILFGEVFISDNEKACLLVKYTHLEKTTLKTIKLDLRLAFKCIGIERVYKVLKRQQIAKRNYPKGKHIRPVILGVKKEMNGKGTAARLLLKLMHHFKDNKLPVILDAASEKNVNLYQKFGFKIIKKDESLGFPMWFLRLN